MSATIFSNILEVFSLLLLVTGFVAQSYFFCFIWIWVSINSNKTYMFNSDQIWEKENGSLTIFPSINVYK